MTRRLNRALQYAIAANIFVAVLLLLLGDTKNAMLGLFGAGLFFAALLISERPGV